MGLTGFGATTQVKNKGSYNFEHELWFSKEGYTPHFAEHIIDPTDNKEKLVMADPHTRYSAFIWNIADQRIEWEYQFSAPTGEQVHNPHTARMILEDISGFGDAGDIYCCNPDQEIIVIDRDTKEIKKTITTFFSPSFLHEACLSVDNDALIVTDYTLPKIAKITFAGAEVWSLADCWGMPGKVHIIKNAHAEAHDPSFGGDYLICANAAMGQVNEIKDDGTRIWACPNSQDGQGMNVPYPHTAMRIGRAEWAGNITVVCCEAGGGIVGLTFTRFPLFAIGGRLTKTYGGSEMYNPSISGLCETTHVFPTLDGKIGFIDWGGENRSNVGVILSFPERQQVSHRLSRLHDTSNSWDFTEYLPVGDWDETYIVAKNTGGGGKELSWRILGCLYTYADYSGHPEMWVEEMASADIADGAEDSHTISRPYTVIRVDFKSKVADNHTKIDIYVTHKRGA